MGIDPSNPIHSVVPAVPTVARGGSGVPAADGALGATEFQRLLEQLDALRQPAPTAAAPGAVPPHDEADALADALRQADDDFAKVMELRRHLEDAFRRHGPTT